MRVEIVSLDKVKQSSRSEYNRNEWVKILDSYTKRGNETIFYKDIEKDEVYYVIYRVDGLLFFKEISYSSCLSSNGFKRVFINQETKVITFLTFTDGKGKWGLLENTEPNRKIFRNTNIILTNEF